jgi:hydroxymethylpyrimidine/phosphomethylpyrimidine kinase
VPAFCLLLLAVPNLQTIMANGGFGMTVLTALTAQNSTGVQGIFVVPPAFLQQQLTSVFSDLPPAAVKTGMLPDAAAVEAVAIALRQYGAGSAASSSAANGLGAAPGNRRPQELPVVVDPVMVSTSGHSLAKESVCAALKQHLIPLATMITPNLAEAQALLGEHRLFCAALCSEVEVERLPAAVVAGMLLLSEHTYQQCLRDNELKAHGIVCAVDSCLPAHCHQVLLFCCHVLQETATHWLPE